MRVLLHTGKGGVGKTTLALATALAAAEHGHRVCVLSTDPAHSLADALAVPVGPDMKRVADGVWAREIRAQTELDRAWTPVQAWLRALIREDADDLVAEELLAFPGIEELMALRAVREAEASGAFDTCVVDCAPTGSTLRLVTLPEVAHGGMRWLLRLQRAAAHVAEPIARGLVGMPLPKADVFAEAERLLFQTLGRLRDRLLSDETSVRIVVTPESMVIDEARRALTDLALFELGTDAVVLNRMLPAEALEEAFFQDWGRAQDERRAEVASAFAPLPILEAPLAEDEVRGVAALAEHGARLFGERAPSAPLGDGVGLRFERNDVGGRLRLPLSGHDAKSLDVARIEDELVIGVAGRRRRIALPAGFARLEIERVAIEEASLVVAFGPPEPAGGVAP